MAIHEKDLLEALSSSRILASMITPAVLISACGTLILSTATRLGRIFDRVNVIKKEIDDVVTSRTGYPEESLMYLKGQLDLQRKRASLIQKSMFSLYFATLLFISSSLAIAFNIAYGSNEQGWIPTLIAIAGGLFLFAASALLLYESRFNLRFVVKHIDFVEFLHDKAEEKEKKS